METRVILVLILLSKLTFAQLILESGFKPTSLATDLYVTSSVKIDNAEESFAKYTKRENRLSLQKYYASTNFQIDKLFQQGKVSCNNEATRYIEKVLLSMGLTGYNVYIYMSPYPNAFATDRKEIFINAGLLSLLENEAELAFILCHEAMHVNRRHTLSSYMNEYDIDVDDKEISKLSVDAKVEFTQHSYSKNVELEADSLGLNIFSLSDYDLKAALTSISKLDGAMIPLDGRKLALKKLFMGKYFNLKKYEKMVGDSIDKESTTHPSSELRYETIKRRIKSLTGGTKKYVVSKKTFLSLKNQVLKHLPAMFLNVGNVNSSMYSAVQLMDKNNEFEQRKTILKCLYKLLVYKHHYSVDDYSDVDAQHPDEIIKIAKMFLDLSVESLVQIGFSEIDAMSKNKKWAKDKEFQEISWRFHYENLLVNDIVAKIFSGNISSFATDADEAPSFHSDIDSILLTSHKSYKVDSTSAAYKKAHKVHTTTVLRMIAIKGGVSKRKLRGYYHYDKFDVISPYFNRFRLNKLDVFRPVESDEGRSKILEKYQRIEKKNPNIQIYDNYLMKGNDVESYCELVSYWTLIEELDDFNPLVATMPTYYNAFKNLYGENESRILIQQNIANASRIRKFNWIAGVFLSLYYIPVYALVARTGAYVSITSSYDISTGQLVLLKDEFHKSRGNYSDYIGQLKKSIKILE